MHRIGCYSKSISCLKVLLVCFPKQETRDGLCKKLKNEGCSSFYNFTNLYNNQKRRVLYAYIQLAEARGSPTQPI
jgi:hypothetical protein